MSKPVDLTDKTFEEEVLKSDIPVLVDFWAPWCMPCRLMAPVLEEAAEELDGKIKIAKINTDIPSHQPLAVRYQIMSIPNMKLFVNGEVAKEIIGLRPKEALLAELSEYIKD